MLQTLKIAFNVVADVAFDWKHGTDTMRWVEVDSFETASQNKVHAVRYQASKARPLLKLFHQLDLPNKDGAFVDLGCGKGRVLLIAAQLGFKRVVGIEFCAHLCRQARVNAELFRQRYPACSPIGVIESDVAQHQFTGDEYVFFLYNPFGSVVLAQTLENITESVRKSPRDILLIYNTPLHHETIKTEGRFARDDQFKIGGTDFHVYSEFNHQFERPAVRTTNS